MSNSQWFSMNLASSSKCSLAETGTTVDCWTCSLDTVEQECWRRVKWSQNDDLTFFLIAEFWAISSCSGISHRMSVSAIHLLLKWVHSMSGTHLCSLMLTAFNLNKVTASFRFQVASEHLAAQRYSSSKFHSFNSFKLKALTFANSYSKLLVYALQ